MTQFYKFQFQPPEERTIYLSPDTLPYWSFMSLILMLVCYLAGCYLTPSMKGSCFVMFNSQNILDLAVNGLEAGVIRSQRLGGTSLQEKNIKRLTPGMGAFNMMDTNNGLKIIITSHHT